MLPKFRYTNSSKSFLYINKQFYYASMYTHEKSPIGKVEKNHM